MAWKKIVLGSGTSSQYIKGDGSFGTYSTTDSTKLPLSGGTLTGALTGTSATLTESFSYANRPLILNNGTAETGSAYDMLVINSNDAPTIRLNETGSNQELTINVGDENTNSGQIGVTGKLVFSTNRSAGAMGYTQESNTIALTLDTSQNATFAGTVALADDKVIKFGASTDGTLQYVSATNIFAASIGADAGIITQQAGSTNNYWSKILLGARGASTTGFKVYTRSTERFSIADDTGNATFAGNVTTDHIYANSGNSYDIGQAGTMFNRGYFLELTGYTSISGGTISGTTGTFTGDIRSSRSYSGSTPIAIFRNGVAPAPVSYDTFVVSADDVPCISIVETNGGVQSNEQQLKLAVGDSDAVISTANVSGGLHLRVNRGTGQSGYAENLGTAGLHIANDGNATFGGNVSLSNDKYIAVGQINFHNVNASGLTEYVKIRASGSSAVKSGIGLGSGNGDLTIYSDKDDASAGNIIFQTQGTTALTINSSQNATFTGAVTTSGLLTINNKLGINTSSPASWDGEGDDFVIYNTSFPGMTIATNSTTGRGSILWADGTTGSEKYRGGITYDHGTGVSGSTVADSMYFRTASNINMALTGAGNVGIGTASPVDTLQITSPAYNSATNDPDYFKALKLQMEEGSYWAQQAQFKLGRWESIVGSHSRSSLVIALAHADVAESADADVDVITFRSDGNVGIGTDNPSDILHAQSGTNGKHVFGQGYTHTRAESASIALQRTGGNLSSPAIIASTGAGSGTILANIGADAYSTGGGGASFHRACGIKFVTDQNFTTNDAPGAVTFYTRADYATGDEEQMRITSAGKIGIGTASPSDHVHILTDGTNGATLRVQNTDTTDPYGMVVDNSGANSSDANYVADFRVGGTSVLKIENSGNATFAGDVQVNGANLKHGDTSTDLQTSVNNLTIAKNNDYQGRLTWGRYGYQIWEMGGQSTNSYLKFKTWGGSSYHDNVFFYNDGTTLFNYDSTFAGELLVNNKRTNLRLDSTQTAPNKLSTVLMIKGYLGTTGTAYSGIGFNYNSSGDVQPPAWIGIQGMSNAGHSKADIVFATRSVTTDTAPTERMRIATDGTATFAGNIIGSGLRMSNYMEIRADDAELYWENTANTNYWRWRRDAFNQFILDHYNGSNTSSALTFDTSRNATFAGQVKVTSSNASGVAFSVGDAGTGWYNTGTNAIGLAINGTQKFAVNSSGNATFAGNVTVSGGQLYVSHVTNPYLYLNDLDGGKGLFQVENTYTKVGSDSNHEFKLVQNNQTAVTIDTSKNATFAGDVNMTTGNGINIAGAGGNIALGDSNTSNGSPSVIFQGSNSATNWRIRQNDVTAGDFTITPSTAGGGTTFSASALSILPNTHATFAGNIITNGNDMTMNGITSSSRTGFTLRNYQGGTRITLGAGSGGFLDDRARIDGDYGSGGSGGNLKFSVKDTSNNVNAVLTLDRDKNATFEGEVYAKGGLQVGSSFGETMESYEEGTWTPAFNESGTSSTSVTNRYTRIGNVVHLWCHLSNIQKTGTPTTDLTITGLPFSVEMGQTCGTAMMNLVITKSKAMNLSVHVNSADDLFLYQTTYNNSWDKVDWSDIEDNDDIYFHATYRTDA